MEQGLAVKLNALEVLEKQLRLRAKKGQYGIVVVGSATDAYIHHEKKWCITKGMLELLLKYRFPVFISTKCDLILRDIELLKEIDKTAILPADLQQTLKRGLILSISLSTMDTAITSVLEPGAIAPLQRLALIQRLKQESLLSGVNAIPLLPFISDSEAAMEEMIRCAKEYGADYILTGGLTLFRNQPADSKMLYYRFLEKYNPSLIAAYNNLYRGNFYTPRYYQDQLKERAKRLCNKYRIKNSIIE